MKPQKHGGRVRLKFLPGEYCITEEGGIRQVKEVRIVRGDIQYGVGLRYADVPSDFVDVGDVYTDTEFLKKANNTILCRQEIQDDYERRGE